MTEDTTTRTEERDQATIEVETRTLRDDEVQDAERRREGL